MKKNIEDLFSFSDISDDSSSYSSIGGCGQGTKVQNDDLVIEDSLKSKNYFEEFRNNKRKRNLIHSRPLRPRSCKKDKELPFASVVVPKPPRLKYDKIEAVYVPKKFRTELKHLT